MSDIRPIVVDAHTRREHLREKTVEGLQGLFPLVARDQDLFVENVRVKPAAYSSNDQKAAILHGRTLAEPVVGDLILKNKNGDILETKKNHILAHLPYFTERHSMIVGGNEYEVPNQLRLKPGVYTRERGNGEYEAAFNLSKGDNFRISMEPDTGKMKAEFGTTTVPLRPVLRALGLTDKTIKQHWGSELFEANLASRGASDTKAVGKLVSRLKRPGETVADIPEAHDRFLSEYFDRTRMDPDVNKRTLGHGFDRVTAGALLAASNKLLKVHRGEDEGDDRDSLEFKTVHTIDDFFKERLEKEAKRTVGNKLVWKINQSKGKTLKEMVPNSPFTRPLNSFLTTSTIAAIPTQYNPAALVDSASKMTSLGEGGIGSERAIPFEARKVHSTHYGVLDPVRTPECYDDQTEVFTDSGWVLWKDVTEETRLACRVDDILAFHAPLELFEAPYTGVMYGMRTRSIDVLVTPNHRVLYRPWGSKNRAPTWRLRPADHVPPTDIVLDSGHLPGGDTLASTFQIATATSKLKNNPCKPVPPIHAADWAEFLGWYLSEGNCRFDVDTSDYRVMITQCQGVNAANCARIERLLARLPFSFSNSNGETYVAASKSLATYLYPLGKSHEKYIPEWVFTSPIAAREAFVHAMFAGDGTWHTRAEGRAKHRISYTSTSRSLVQGLERVLIGLGYVCKITHRTFPRINNRKDQYELRVLSGRERSVLKKKGHHYTTHYEGMVYCATVPGSLLYVRRNGSVPVWSGNSGHAGIDIRASMGAHKDAQGNMYGTFRNARSGKLEQVSVQRLAQSVVGFSGQEKRKGNHDALRGEDIVSVKPHEVDYYLNDPTHQFSPITALVPFLDGSQGNRLMMGAKFQGQALPLLQRDVPYVQAQAPRSGESMTKEIARLTVPTSKHHGVVERVDADYIYIRPDMGKHASAAGRPTAVLVTGNPKHITGNPHAKAFYDQVHQALEQQGYEVSRDPGAPYTQPKPADLWVGHSMGVDRLRFAPEGTRTIALGVPEGIHHPEDNVLAVLAGKDTTPNLHHFTLTPEMLAAFRRNKHASVMEKCAEYEDYEEFPELQVPTYCAAHDGEKTAAKKPGVSDDGLIKLPYDTNFPLAAKTYLHNTVKVKAGDRVAPGQLLADSNFTKDDHIALGKNMSVGYLAYYGKNSNDAVVISEGAAKKLTSEHMYKETLRKTSDTIQDKAKYATYYGMRFTRAQLDKLDAQGLPKPGVRLEPGDPVLLALEKASPSPDAQMLGHLHKSLVKPYRDAAVVWEHHVPGEVVDVVNAARQAVATVRTQEPMKIGDKLANRFGGKGVVSEIVADHQMVHDENQKPIDILFTSAGIVSRINPAQVVESALGKVVEKTGKPYVLPQFMDMNNVDFAKAELKKHNIKDKETVYDPVSGRNIPNVFVGRSYIHKLFKSTESNYSARGVSKYDVNLQPTKGGEEGAKGLGKMEINTLLAHNARNVLKDALSIKSEKSDDYWRAMEFGLPAPPPKSPFVVDKFHAMVQGAGINLDKRGTNIALGALTDDHVQKMSAGALTLPSLEKSKSFMVTAKDLKPEKGGLFDPIITGGHSGTRWSHIDLPEPILNPVFEDPARRLLGMTKAQVRNEFATRGGAALKKQLNDIDLAATERQLVKTTQTARGAKLDDAVKQLKYVRALREQGHKGAGDAYVVSKIPVIPPVMRPILPSMNRGELQISDANYLYRDLALAAAGLHAANEVGLPELSADARTHLYGASAALAGIGDPVSPQLQGRGVKGFISQISGQGSPKQGFLFKKVLKRQQDMSMRGTATPDNTLDMDQIGVPEDMLWVTYDKFIMKGLIGQGFPATRAKEMIEERHPAAKAVLAQELKTRPIFVNRAPSLHRHNMVAAFPVAVAGKSLRINPFMEKGQNLDYDGDTMQLHVPVSPKAVAEARELTLSKLLFGDKNRDDLMIFPQHEAIIGAYLATSGAAKGRKRKFATKADAMAAYKRGEITLGTPVEIG